MHKYIKNIIQKCKSVIPKRLEGQTNEEYQQVLKEWGLKAGAAVLMALAVVSSIMAVTGSTVTVSNSVNGKELPVYCVETEKKQVALSFDAAWGNEDIQVILNILKKQNVHATFFMTGEWVESFPSDVKALLDAGHDLGNHGENHKEMSKLTDEQCQEELMKVHDKVKELTGHEMNLFRPPYGDYDNHVIKNATKCGYLTIQWDVDSLDWKDYGAESIIKTVCQHKNLGNGSIILCHNGAKYTAQALDAMLTRLKAEGYEVVSVSELVYTDNYHLNHEGRQIPNK